MKQFFPVRYFFLAGALVLRAVAAEPDIPLADFEADDYGEWKASGNAFGVAPARGALPSQMPVEGFKGKGLVNSYLGGDGAVGTLTSPEFAIRRKFISFLIGGGGHKGRTCVNLRVGDRIVRSATGPNTAPGGSEALADEVFEVAEFTGQSARIEIVDRETGGWGHINADHFILTDAPPLQLHAEREIVCDKMYLNLPIRTGAKKRLVKLTVEGQVVREFEAELADADAEFWVFLDLTPFRGKRAAVTVDRLGQGSSALTSMEVADTVKGTDDLYHEKLRPQYHFSSRRGWLNDPNGLVFYEGEYHLFYQHNPYGWSWGNMHWGHAVSADLVHWKELPIALYPHRFNDWAFSGSAVVDQANTSGWKRGDEDVLVAAYTSTGRGECIIRSHDRGRTWIEFEGNPVVRHEGRDPRLLWHQPSMQWVMVLYSEAEKKQWITFHTSPDLKKWTFQSRIEGFYECPDLFELALDGDPEKKRWILTAASSEYMIGHFDGRSFVPETPKLPGHRGEGFYAAQTYSNEPRGRCVQIGWGQFESPGMPFNQMMCFPTALSLRMTPDGPRLCWQPVAEIERLRRRSHRFPSEGLKPGDNPLSGVKADAVELRASIATGGAREIAFAVGPIELRYDVAQQELVAKNFRVPLGLSDGRLRLVILRDRTSVEVFGGAGEVYLPLRVPVTAANEWPLSLQAVGGEARIEQLDLHELSSIWPAR